MRTTGCSHEQQRGNMQKPKIIYLWKSKRDSENLPSARSIFAMEKINSAYEEGGNWWAQHEDIPPSVLPRETGGVIAPTAKCPEGSSSPKLIPTKYVKPLKKKQPPTKNL